MKGISLKNIFLYGFLIWVIPFAIAFAIYPVRDNNRALFESIMPLVLIVVTLFSTLRVYRQMKHESLVTGILLGAIWMTISIVIDFPIFVLGPIHMTPNEYFYDIALSYLLIPLLTSGIVYAKHYDKENST